MATKARKSTKQAVAKTSTKAIPASKTAAGTVVRKARQRAQPAGKQAARKPRRITPAQALANTRALLEAKQAHDRQPPPWQALDPQGGPLPQPGFQSDAARLKADELHAGESRLPAIQGSISTQDRHQQGKRDER